MKKVLWMLWILLLLPGWARSQNGYEQDDRPFTGGLIIGTNISKVDDIDDFTHFHKVGWNLGGIVKINFTPKISLGFEMLFSQKGDHEINQDYSYSVGSYFSEYYLRLNYVEIPVTLHYKQKKFDYEAGFSVARLVSFFESISTDQPINLDPNVFYFNKWDYEFIMGGSYNFWPHYYLNVRYQFSMANIRPLERMPLTYYNYDGQQNSVVNIRLVYLF